MKKIKNNPALSMYAITPFIEEMMKDKEVDFKAVEMTTIQKAMSLGYYLLDCGIPDVNVFVDTKLKGKAWKLITKKNTYYSKGDNSA